jgi:hypothetical protein
MYGAAKSPGLGQIPSSKIVRQNNICMIPVVGSQRATGMTEAVEILIAKLCSQGKLAMPRCEN